MTFGKASLIAMGFVASMAIGVWMAPHVTDVEARRGEAVADTSLTASEIVHAPATETRRADMARETATRIASVAPSAPDLHKRLRPVLSKGANMQIAADGFESAEQFATVAYLSRNTGIPFMLLKHRVLNEGHSLEEAVTMSKPDVDTGIAVNRARAEARSEVWAIGGVNAS